MNMEAEFKDFTNEKPVAPSLTLEPDLVSEPELAVVEETQLQQKVAEPVLTLQGGKHADPAAFRNYRCPL